MKCPACSSVKHEKHGEVSGVYVCRSCGAVHGQCYLGESYGLVQPYWHEGPSSPEQERYYDFETVGSKGLDRRHGWFNVESKRITQTG